MIKEAELTGLSKAFLAGLGLTAAGGTGVAIYDTIKAREHPVVNFKASLKENPTSVKKYLAEQDAKVVLLDSAKSVNSYAKDVMAKEHGEEQARLTGSIMKQMIRSGENAAAIPSKNDAFDAIISSKKINPIVIEHELGHIKDFRSLKKEGVKPTEWYGGQGFGRGLMRGLSKDVFDEDVIEKEKNAWKHVAESDAKTRMMTPAMNTYHQGFHINRGAVAGALAGGSAAALAAMALLKGKADPSIGQLAAAGLGGYAGLVGGALAPILIGSANNSEK